MKLFLPILLCSFLFLTIAQSQETTIPGDEYYDPEITPDDVDPILMNYVLTNSGTGKGRGFFSRIFRKIKKAVSRVWKRLTGRKASWKVECIPKLQKNCCWPWDIYCIRKGK
ncbi:hypothetical protein SNEBB_001703 [Seison nebaliae]|nr:hypothetical protein SNEBB_001703 [Seison nebaliae]